MVGLRCIEISAIYITFFNYFFVLLMLKGRRYVKNIDVNNVVLCHISNNLHY